MTLVTAAVLAILGAALAQDLALRRAKVPAELHIYEKGPHGFGLGNDRNPELKSWPDRLAAWLGVRGVLGRRPQAPVAPVDSC